MSIIRVNKRKTYKTISSVPLLDRQITWAARGVLVHLLGQADSWEINVTALIERGRGAKRDKMYSILAELESLGYCKKSPRQKVNGQMDGWEYEIFEEPISGVGQESPKGAKSRLRQNRNTAQPSHGKNDTNYNENKTNKDSNKAVAVRRPISSNWRPGIEVVEILEQKGIPRNFIEDAVPEFVLYWRDAGTPHISWGAKFVQYVKSQWEIYRGKTDRQMTAFESLTDRSWAKDIVAENESDDRQIADGSAGEGGDE
ncbi:MAG: hypothetical protein JWM78_1879 [Verrucomicrobiaceae bacterium]|nr:hypothetical protein [Verrucomicrobiaceae bacterium]